MASPKSIAIACEKSCTEIENTIGVSGLPRRNRDREILRRDQLRWIANNIAIPHKYIKAEQLARNGATKSEIVEALLGDDK